MWRTQEDRVGLTHRISVVLIEAAPSNQSLVLVASDGLANSNLSRSSRSQAIVPASFRFETNSKISASFALPICVANRTCEAPAVRCSQVKPLSGASLGGRTNVHSAGCNGASIKYDHSQFYWLLQKRPIKPSNARVLLFFFPVQQCSSRQITRAPERRAF